MKKSSMRKLGILLAVLLIILTSACGKTAQTNNYVNGFVNLSVKSIYSDEIVKTITELSSKKYDGRLAGSEGNELAGDYIAEYFKNIGLGMPETLGSYRQTYTQPVMTLKSAPLLQIVDRKGKVIKNFIYPDNFIVIKSVQGISINGGISAEGVIFTNKDELKKNLDKIKGKIVIINQNVRNQIGDNDMLVQMIKSYGAKGIVIELNTVYKHLVVSSSALNEFKYDNNGMLAVYTENNTFKEISDLMSKGNLIRIKLDYQPKKVEASNIIGVIPGSDPKLKNEYIIISGHFDHVGDNKNGTYNPGALDNASGAATVMEVAKAVKEAKTPPQKTVIFIAFNGEEEGLLGSYYYTENPVFPMNKDNTTVINIDMVGSKNVMPLVLANYNEYDTKLSEDMYKYAGDLGIDCTKSNKEEGSDHMSFAQRGIQALTLINMDIENPGYHTPKDKADDTIDQERIGQIAKLVMYYIDKNAYK